jgi:hypothetical protein
LKEPPKWSPYGVALRMDFIGICFEEALKPSEEFPKFK